MSPLVHRFPPRFFSGIARPCAALLIGVTAWAAEKDDLAWMDLEQLGQIKVITSSKRPEPAWKTGSALTVISAEEISFSGANSLPAALRFVPGLNVAQIDTRNWAVSARGFNAQYSNKLLVLIDGRSIYTPLFGGVLWDTPDTPLEDLARIEVVRGPGGSLWGANAVNGVINFVTAPAADTPGTLVVADAGTLVRRGLLRQGFKPAEDWAGRVYAQATRREPTLMANGSEADDRWRNESAGFRVDRTKPGDLELTFSGEAHAGSGGQTQTIASGIDPVGRAPAAKSEAHTRGGHLLARAERREADGGGLMGQAYFEAARFSSFILGGRRQTFDIEVQKDKSIGAHLVSLGAGYRYSRVASSASASTSLEPSAETERIANLSLQAQFSLVPDRVEVVAGAKVEQRNGTGAQLQPSVRGVWHISEGQTLWVAASRAVRTPSFLERAIRLDAAALPAGALGAGTQPTLVRWYGGGEQLAPETVVAGEAGWRTRVNRLLSFDASTFLNRYDRLVDIVPTGVFTPENRFGTPYRVWRWDYVNGLDGVGYGGELAATFHPALRTQITAGYTFTRIEQEGRADGLNLDYFNNSTPRHAFFLRAGYGWGVWAAHAELRTMGGASAVGVAGYTAVDARLVWHASPEITITLAGENLADPAHAEFRNGASLVTTELRRGFSLKLTWSQ